MGHLPTPSDGNRPGATSRGRATAGRSGSEWVGVGRSGTEWVGVGRSGTERVACGSETRSVGPVTSRRAGVDRREARRRLHRPGVAVRPRDPRRRRRVRDAAGLQRGPVRVVPPPGPPRGLGPGPGPGGPAGGRTAGRGRGRPAGERARRGPPTHHDHGRAGPARLGAGRLAAHGDRRRHAVPRLGPDGRRRGGAVAAQRTRCGRGPEDDLLRRERRGPGPRATTGQARRSSPTPGGSCARRPGRTSSWSPTAWCGPRPSRRAASRG